MVTPRTLSGFKDRLPSEAIIKHNVIEKLSKVFRSFGFAPIETPHLEYADILIKQGSDEIQKELYRFTDHGERDVALRFDLTVPLARFVSQHKEALGLPFKRYAIGNVFRGERAQAGRYREFTQCDFDFIGTTSASSDAEIILVIYESLKALGIESFTIRINNRKIMNGLCKSLGVDDKIEAILREVDKIEKVGEEKVLESLTSLQIEKQKAAQIIEFIKIKENGGDFFSTIAEYEQNEFMVEGIKELKKIYGILSAIEMPKSAYAIDFSIARGLGYYTGIVYETVLNELPTIGSVASGGRYDNLTQNFSKEKMEGVGASIGLDRLLAALEQLGRLDRKETPSSVLVMPLDEEIEAESAKITKKLRDSSIGAELYPAPHKLKKQLAYANKKGHEFVLFLGQDEIKNSVVTIRNMKNGTQIDMVSLSDAISHIKHTLYGGN